MVWCVIHRHNINDSYRNYKSDDRFTSHMSKSDSAYYQMLFIWIVIIFLPPSQYFWTNINTFTVIEATFRFLLRYKQLLLLFGMYNLEFTFCFYNCCRFFCNMSKPYHIVINTTYNLIQINRYINSIGFSKYNLHLFSLI